MQQGIYITANDRVLDQAIALLSSIRCYDSTTPVVLIPYDDYYQQVAARLQQYGVTLYPDLDRVKRLSIEIQAIFGDRFFARPNNLRKQACWFGEFDRFLYLDTDIVVFDRIVQTLDYLEDYDFVCADYQHRSGLTNVFTDQIVADRVFPADISESVFNSGFWASKKHLISETDLLETFRECAANPDYFDFSQKTSDQPIINYLVLKRIQRRLNLVQRSRMDQQSWLCSAEGRVSNPPGNWAGSSHFVQEGFRLFDPQAQDWLHYLHWAGIRIQPGCPYWNLWRHYRYLQDEPASLPLWHRVVTKLGEMVRIP